MLARIVGESDTGRVGNDVGCHRTSKADRLASHQTVSAAWDQELVPDARGSSRRPDPGCPVEVALTAVSGRWATLVLRDLMHGPRAFSELQAALPTLSAKVLSERLVGFERQGLVHCRRGGGFPSRSVYSLTAAGQHLRPLLVQLYETGRRLLDEEAVAHSESTAQPS
ncbi:MAG: transcriptional regulator [Pseudonocardiales bacterium]|nr:MAG: transcriptional regulator [Pseudonocardiales bacterium]